MGAPPRGRTAVRQKGRRRDSTSGGPPRGRTAAPHCAALRVSGHSTKIGSGHWPGFGHARSGRALPARRVGATRGSAIAVGGFVAPAARALALARQGPCEGQRETGSAARPSNRPVDSPYDP